MDSQDKQNIKLWLYIFIMLIFLYVFQLTQTSATKDDKENINEDDSAEKRIWSVLADHEKELLMNLHDDWKVLNENEKKKQKIKKQKKTEL